MSASTNPFSLENRTAVVTGANSGIGQAIAVAMAAAGARVVAVGRSPMDETVGMIGDASRVHAIKADLSVMSGLPAVIDEALAWAGTVDILVNNAGITRDGLAMRMKDEDWQTVLDVNLSAAFRLARASLKGMMKRRWGRIISITSVVGATGNPGQLNYAAAKAGLTGMTKSLAQEVASRNITANCVAPGFIQTAMTDVLTDQQKEQISQKIPAGRLGQSPEVAAAVVYLASEEAAYVTGQTIHVNGGMAMIS